MKGNIYGGTVFSIQCYGSDLIKRVCEQTKRKEYKISLLSGNPISSTLTTPLFVAYEALEKCTLPVEVKHSLIIECQKKALDIIDESTAEYLMIDLFNEITDRYVLTSNSAKSEMTCYNNASFEMIIQSLYPDWKISKRKCYEISDTEITQIFSGICSYFKKRFNQEKIIVVEGYCADRFLDNDCVFRKYPESFEVEKINAYLKKCYKVILNSLPNCKFIRYPNWSYGQINTIRGVNPSIHERHYYSYISKALDAATGLAPEYTVENVFNTQQIENRINERAVNSNIVWALNEKIKKLEGEIADLKKNNM